MKKRTRLAKMARFAEDHGLSIDFFGWEREFGELNRFRWGGEQINERAILRGGGYATRFARLLYPIWMALVFLKCLFLPKRSVVWCLGWETAFPARLASAVRNLDIVFDDADRFSMLIRLPGPLQALLVKLEKWTSYKSKVHLVPGWSRYEWQHTGMVLLRNSPLRADYEHALELSKSDRNYAITLYVNGWIAWDTGARIVMKALDELHARGVDCKLIVAGRVASVDGQALIARHDVEFKGELPQRKALELYRSSDIALTLYDPSVPINRHAESNKWGDCVFLGTPFIVNSEVQTATKFVESCASLNFEYNDYITLANIIEKLSNDRSILSILKINLSQFKPEYLPFEDQLMQIFNKYVIG